MENDIRKWIRLIESVDVPDILYHGTFRHHLPSIMHHGLGGKITRKNFDISGSGVYLVDDPDVAENWVADNEFGNHGDIIVLEIDISKLDLSLLSDDPNDEGERGGRSYHYKGIIPTDAIKNPPVERLMEEALKAIFPIALRSPYEGLTEMELLLKYTQNSNLTSEQKLECHNLFEKIKNLFYSRRSM